MNRSSTLQVNALNVPAWSPQRTGGCQGTIWAPEPASESHITGVAATQTPHNASRHSRRVLIEQMAQAGVNQGAARPSNDYCLRNFLHSTKLAEPNWLDDNPSH